MDVNHLGRILAASIQPILGLLRRSPAWLLRYNRSEEKISEVARNELSRDF
jgi:hypothetical protein